MTTHYRLRVTDPESYPEGPVLLPLRYTTPMEAMATINLDFTSSGGYGSCHKVECFRFQDDETCLERQWILEID